MKIRILMHAKEKVDLIDSYVTVNEIAKSGKLSHMPFNDVLEG